MLSIICQYLKNWFDYNQKKFIGDIIIENGQLDIADEIQTNQYYRIVGSVFNDGVYKKGEETLTDETFEGGVWLMAIPKDVLDIAAEIEDWCAKYEDISSEAMSPFQSESFGGYSYTKASGGNSSDGGSSVPTWQSVFGTRLRRWKKI